ncbi:MAG: hypothetical protein IPJ65_34230 [Archangiaceae bacterium]|nr:hypothetical protein [Archangiaceae bacterium]
MPRAVDIVLVTEAKPPAERVPYLKAELEPLRAEFARRGVSVEVAGWDDPSYDWSRVGLALVRTPWNYYLHLEAFLAWTRRVPRLLNGPEVVAWNAHKEYLRELERGGLPVVPTVWVENEVSLDGALAERGWHDAVLKPAVSGGAFRTRRFARGAAPQGLLTEILSGGGMAMLQPYLPSVETTGERSLVFFGGKLSHVVRRKPPLSTGEHGAYAAEAAADELALAERFLSRHAGLLYARVDLTRDAAGEPCLMELELIEPSFFLEVFPEAAGRFVDAALAAR